MTDHASPMTLEEAQALLTTTLTTLEQAGFGLVYTSGGMGEIVSGMAAQAVHHRGPTMCSSCRRGSVIYGRQEMPSGIRLRFCNVCWPVWQELRGEEQAAN